MIFLTKGESMDFAIRKIGGAIVCVLVVALVLAGACGWIENIIKMVHMLDGPATAMFIARIVGIFAAPLGMILGYL